MASRVLAFDRCYDLFYASSIQSTDGTLDTAKAVISNRSYPLLDLEQVKFAPTYGETFLLILSAFIKFIACVAFLLIFFLCHIVIFRLPPFILSTQTLFEDCYLTLVPSTSVHNIAKLSIL